MIGYTLRVRKSNFGAVLRDADVVFRVQLGHLDGSFALVQPEFRIGQARRNHRCRAVVAESKKDARRQEKLRLTCLRFQRLTVIDRQIETGPALWQGLFQK